MLPNPNQAVSEKHTKLKKKKLNTRKKELFNTGQNPKVQSTDWIFWWKVDEIPVQPTVNSFATMLLERPVPRFLSVKHTLLISCSSLFLGTRKIKIISEVEVKLFCGATAYSPCQM